MPLRLPPDLRSVKPRIALIKLRSVTKAANRPILPRLRRWLRMWSTTRWRQRVRSRPLHHDRRTGRAGPLPPRQTDRRPASTRRSRRDQWRSVRKPTARFRRRSAPPAPPPTGPEAAHAASAAAVPSASTPTEYAVPAGSCPNGAISRVRQPARATDRNHACHDGPHGSPSSTTSRCLADPHGGVWLGVAAGTVVPGTAPSSQRLDLTELAASDHTIAGSVAIAIAEGDRVDICVSRRG